MAWEQVNSIAKKKRLQTIIASFVVFFIGNQQFFVKLRDNLVD